MSKTKGKTIEELLKEAMVPEDEQPYMVPGNWIWVRIGSITNFIDYRGKTPTKTQSGVPLITAKNVRMNHLNEEPREYIAEDDYDNWMTRGIPKIGDILFTTEAPLGNVAELNIEGKVALAQRIITIQTTNFNNRYLKYVLMSPQIQNIIQSNSTGTTVQGIKASKLKLIPIPLAPLNEQKRIADKVERLFDKINQAKQLVEEAKETFELRRAAILVKAFRGEMTAKWREENPNIESFREWLEKNGVEISNTEKYNVPYELPKGWGWVKFSDVASVISNLVQPSEYGTFPHIAPDNIEKNTGKLLEYVTIDEAGVKSPKHLFHKGQIIYSKIRPYLSKVIIAEFSGLCSADMYPINTHLNTEYLFWFMLSPFFVEKASTAGSRSVLPKINQKELGEILVPICGLEEQLEIVSIIKKILRLNSDYLHALEESSRKFDLMQQTILTRAFTGQLGTNDLTENSAIELLKENLKNINFTFEILTKIKIKDIKKPKHL